MPRARQIKYGFFLNEQLAELPPLCRLLFQGLWLLADREGKLENRPKKIHAQILPYDKDADICAFLCALEDAQFLRRYAIGDAQFIKILNFKEHQNPHQNETESIIPEPKTQPSGASTIQEPEQHSTNPASMLVPSMLDNIKKEKNIKKRKKNPSVKFEQFYKSYPRRKDRDRAWIAFEKLHPDDELFADIMQAVENQKAEYNLKHDDADYQFFKYAAPWLNGRCWTDEIDLPKPVRNPYGNCKRCGKPKNTTMDYCSKCEEELYPPRSKKSVERGVKKIKNFLPGVAHV